MPLPRLADILDQPATIAFLNGVVASRRFGNAYLLHGPGGVGKGMTALAFARAILCEQAGGGRAATTGDLLAAAAPATVAAPALGDACGTCSACVKSADLQHPDLKFLFPVSGEERDLDQTITATLQALRDDPIHVFGYDKAASIRMSMTRELLRELAFQPYESAHRVVVVRDADRMREDQYSAMLKTLEEPGVATIWVLTTSRLSRLPATIRSRCQRVRFGPVGEATIERVMRERAGMPAGDASLLAAIAGGSLGRALALRDSKPAALRDEALALLRPALDGNPPGLWRAAQAYMKYGKTGRETLRRMIEFHQLWLRDLVRAQADAPAAMLVHRDREDEIRREAERVGASEIRRRLLVLEEALRSIEGNVTADIAIFSAMARLAGGRIGEGQWPVHPIDRWDY